MRGDPRRRPALDFQTKGTPVLSIFTPPCKKPPARMGSRWARTGESSFCWRPRMALRSPPDDGICCPRSDLELGILTIPRRRLDRWELPVIR